MVKARRHHTRLQKLKPKYHGKGWVPVPLPRTVRDWSHGGEKSIITDGKGTRALVAALSDLNRSREWRWPKRRHYFLSDLHGDPEAFAASLVASGGVRKIGPGLRDFELSALGRKADFIIGGDCFDKGPSSLELLRSIRHLIRQGARVRILAGNHDVRVLFGMRVVGKHKDGRNEHFFIRTGQKIIPLLREIWDVYLAERDGLKGVPGEKACRQRLYPRDDWFTRFPEIAEGHLLPAQRERELSKIKKKYDRFEKTCARAGLSIRQVYAAVEKWKQLFLEPDGEFHWFYRNMRLCYRSGSFLFVHAGVDDAVAKMLAEEGIGPLNRAFRRAMKEAPFDFYFGSLCNTVRTKYRKVDRPFTKKGARHIRRAGISAIIHGHRNLHNGQRLAFRKSLINFECDTSLDRHTRKVEKVRGRGASVTIVEQKGYILGVSSDYPHIKVFHPENTLGALAAAQGAATGTTQGVAKKSARKRELNR